MPGAAFAASGTWVELVVPDPVAACVVATGCIAPSPIGGLATGVILLVAVVLEGLGTDHGPEPDLALDARKEVAPIARQDSDK